MLEVVGQDIISGNMGFIGTDPGREYQMGTTEKTEDVTATGNPAVLDNATGKPFKDLHIFGRSEQMTTTGAQILKLVDREPVTISGLTWQIKNQCISVNGTATEEGNVTDFYICGDRNVYEDADFPEGEITISADLPKDIVMYVVKKGGTVLTYITQQNKDGSFEHISGNKYRIMFRVMKKGAIYDNVIKVMFNTGSTALTWEPYTGGKPSPSPDYPQEIVSAGEDGNIGVEVHGKNLFGGRFYYANYANDVLKIDENNKENEVELPFAPTYESFGVCKVIKCQKGKTYVISVTNPNKNAAIGMAEYENIEKAFDINNALGFTRMNDKILKKSYIAKSDGILVCGIAGKWTDGKTTLHECTESELLQVEEAPEATSYEPYHEPQSMSVTTPNGLPGIPVASGGNYTDENGQQWICDEVDLGRGVYVQRIASFVINAKNANDIFVTNLYTHVTVAVNARIRTPEETSNSLEARSNRNLFCEALPWIADEWSSTVNSAGFVENDSIDFTIENSYLGLSEASTNDERKAALVKYFTDKPCQIVYRIATPIETPLTTAEIAAYKSLRTYRGTTIVEAEDKAGISVTFKRNVKTGNVSAEKKIEESEKKEYDES